MSNQPGDGCSDPRDTHPHWCGFCGAYLMFSRLECEYSRAIPWCPRCGETDWKSEIDELISPDYREG